MTDAQAKTIIKLLKAILTFLYKDGSRIDPN